MYFPLLSLHGWGERLGEGRRHNCAVMPKVAVFHSGHEDLYQNTLELLRMNRRRSAARAVQKAKSTPER